MDKAEDAEVDEDDTTVDGVALVDEGELDFAFEDGVDNDDKEEEDEERDNSAGDFIAEAEYFTAGPAATLTAVLGELLLGEGAVVVCGGEDEGRDSEEDGGVSAVIGPATATDAVDGDLELILAFPSSSRGDLTSLLSDVPSSTASSPDLEGSRLARIGFLTESEDSE